MRIKLKWSSEGKAIENYATFTQVMLTIFLAEKTEDHQACKNMENHVDAIMVPSIFYTTMYRITNHFRLPYSSETISSFIKEKGNVA